MLKLPEIYFRTRENGAVVFRLTNDERRRRVSFEQIAIVNIKNGDIKPHSARALSEGEKTAIRAWMVSREEELARRYTDDLLRIVDTLKQAVTWIDTQASDEDFDLVANELLVTIMDMQKIITARMAARLGQPNAEDD